MRRGTVYQCLTPTRNEEWIIEKFARAASLWADQVLVADQGSTDSTAEIARTFDNVIVINNQSDTYDEEARQRLLLQSARSIPVEGAKRILISLDADEAISANFNESEEWRRIADLRPGTVVRFKWANVLPCLKKCWIPSESIAFGLVDDGSEHVGQKIHSQRLPWPPGADVVNITEVVVLHFQYINWYRMRSKQRWYQVWEKLNSRNKRAIQIFRQYNHMLGWPEHEIHPLNHAWFANYEKQGIDFRNTSTARLFWWDLEVIELMMKHGSDSFRKLDIWDVDWNEAAKHFGIKAHNKSLCDPRSYFESVYIDISGGPRKDKRPSLYAQRSKSSEHLVGNFWTYTVR